MYKVYSGNVLRATASTYEAALEWQAAISDVLDSEVTIRIN